MASNFESSIQRGCDFIHDFACSPCEEDGLNTEAQHFCSQCTKLYCDNCVPVHNKLYKRHTVLDRKDVMKWMAAPGTVGALERCMIHPGEALKLVCIDHDQLCCHVCVALDHRHCSSIQHIKDVAKGIRKEPEFRQLPQKVADLRKQIDDMKDSRKKNETSLRKTRAAIVDEIKTIREEFNDILDRIEKTTVQEMDSLIAKHEKSIKKDIETSTQINDALKSIMDAIQINDSSGEPSLYIGFRKCEENIKQANEIVQKMSTVKTYNITFRKYIGIDDLSSIKTFGELNESNITADNPFPSQDHIFAAQGYKEYNVKVSSDKRSCLIGGMCDLTGGEIVITDNGNCSVKLLDQEYRVVDHCNVPEYPQGLCLIGGNEVAVCVNNLDDRCELHFMNVTERKLITTRTLNFTHRCYAADNHGDKLYISDNTSLYVYTMSGQLTKKLYEDKSGDYTVQRMSITSDAIYITNRSKHQISTLDNLGNKLATFTDRDLRGPYGVHATTAGHVFVCCFVTNKVMQIDKNGMRKMAILAREADGLYGPYALFFNSRTSSLVVGGEKDTLLVIKLQ
ncbi:uncharacterized protein LOC128218399 [Mya arenaria]|uniref:uncharacterized protein LOC128218399 n=1 Tax=Mya arenaria TaxID=6604 RepID=UPI0022E04182|nr:uncharacterized protein LOC128218399 [Mya arenaria]